MNKDFISNEIEILIEAIDEQKNQIMSHQNSIPQIELDLILGNIAKLYEQFLILRKKTSSGMPDKERVQMPIITPEVRTTPVEESLPALAETSEPFISYIKEKAPLVSFVVRPNFVAEANLGEIQPSNLINRTETQMPEQQKIVAINSKSTENQESTNGLFEKGTELSEAPMLIDPVAKTAIAEDVDIKPVKEPQKHQIKDQAPINKQSSTLRMGLFDSISTVADKYEGQTSLHDKMSKNQTDQSLGKKLQNKPVLDLKKSIGINEKFSFINELFEGDLNNYNMAIDTLNQCGNLEEARHFIKDQLVDKYKWNQDAKSYKGLLDLIERRFKE